MTEQASAAPATPATVSPALDEQQGITRFIAVLGEVIGVEKVSPDEHFLDAGGDSLSAAILIDWIAQEFGVEPELDWFFESQNIQELATRWWEKVQASRAGAAAVSQ